MLCFRRSEHYSAFDMEFQKLIAICILGAIASILIKNFAPSFSPLLACFISVSVISVCVFCIIPFVEFFNEMTYGTSFSAYSSVLFKVCGVAILTRFASEICKDAGENIYASKVLKIGKTAIMIMSLPILKIMFEQVKDFMN